jgi:hypothetical protein
MNSAVIFNDVMIAIAIVPLLAFAVAPRLFSVFVVKFLRPTNPQRFFEPNLLRWVRIFSVIGLAYIATILLMTIFHVGSEGHAHE